MNKIITVILFLLFLANAKSQNLSKTDTLHIIFGSGFYYDQIDIYGNGILLLTKFLYSNKKNGYAYNDIQIPILGKDSIDLSLVFFEGKYHGWKPFYSKNDIPKRDSDFYSNGKLFTKKLDLNDGRFLKININPKTNERSNHPLHRKSKLELLFEQSKEKPKFD